MISANNNYLSVAQVFECLSLAGDVSIIYNNVIDNNHKFIENYLLLKLINNLFHSFTTL